MRTSNSAEPDENRRRPIKILQTGAWVYLATRLSKTFKLKYPCAAEQMMRKGESSMS